MVLPLLGAFLPNTKFFGYKIGIQFNSSPLVVEQNNYATKTSVHGILVMTLSGML